MSQLVEIAFLKRLTVEINFRKGRSNVTSLQQPSVMTSQDPTRCLQERTKDRG